MMRNSVAASAGRLGLGTTAGFEDSLNETELRDGAGDPAVPIRFQAPDGRLMKLVVGPRHGQQDVDV
jgi:hypothetical protein